MTERAEQFLEENAHGGLQDYDAAVDALAAVGLVSEARAEYWKAEHRRLRAIGTGYEGPYDAELEAKAVELLEDLFTPVARRRDSDDWDPVVYMRFQEALSTLRAIGALSFERARPWMERQQQILRPVEPVPRQPDPEMPFSAGELSAVLPGPPRRLGGMQVTCMELYADCVIVRFHQQLPPEPDDPVERRELLNVHLELEDELGTTYQPARIPRPAGCKPRDLKHWPEVLIGWQAFVPGAPLTARTFTISWRGHDFELTL